MSYKASKWLKMGLAAAMIWGGLMWNADLATAELSARETERIEAFLNKLQQEENLIFIRNGTEYRADDAVSHLRRKLNSARKKINTAEEFIDHVASQSSISGQPYLYKTNAEDQPSPVAPYFHQLLSD